VPRSREIMLGRRDQFAVKVAFLPDPDEGRGACTEYSVSWGSFEIWVNGHNICQHIEQNEPVDAVHWYLLPILKWIARNWDFLLHEERLPAKNAGSDAWLSMARTAEAPPGASDEEAERWETRWHDWWGRHCLLACREGGLLPNLFIRRWCDQIELSWGDRRLAGAPAHFRFEAFHGCARFSPDAIAPVLYSILDESCRHLQNELPDSELVASLARDVAAIETTDHRRRLGLLSGYRSDQAVSADRWESVQAFFPGDLTSGQKSVLFGSYESRLVVYGSCQAALMFGSVSPSVSDADAQLLAAKLVEYYDADGDSAILRQFVRNTPFDRSDDEAWQQGYRLAEDLHEALGQDFASGPAIDIEGLCRHFSITTDDIALDDQSIRAVAIAGEQHRPVMLINKNYEYRETEPRRFTMAHELCHILHDRSYGAQLAMASGPWAPRDIEKRANAFAAMFLMPTALLESVVRPLSVPLNTAAGVWQVAKEMQTSFSATLEHLHNLGFLDEVTRDALRNQMEQRAASSGDLRVGDLTTYSNIQRQRAISRVMPNDQ
jgi:Zn-dependent peptidase ImmA (M78 family)